MCVYIGIEDLVANALIELVENKHKGEVLFRELDEYGAMVVKFLNEEDNEEAVLLLSTERTNAFLHDYTKFFVLYTADNGIDEGIRLRNGVSVDQLWDTFRSYLSADILSAFMNVEALKALGVAA